MKNYKEKYEKALERCKEEFNFNNLAYSHEEIKQKLKHVFPELKENEDERIRKECISIIDAWDKSCRLQGDYCEVAPKCIAWLEKQGELVNSLSKGLDNAHERIDGLIQKNNSLIEQLEKQGEQKPAEWSEEDEKERKRVVGLLEGWLSTFEDTCYAEDCKCGISWLNSLKQRMKGE